MAAPALGDAPPAAAGIADGDSGVATSTGAFTYAYPITVGPGRNGMKPSLSISYSSQGPIYGNAIAAGWSLSGLPIITEDTSNGRLWATAYALPLPKVYQSSMAGGRPLVLVSEPAPSGASTFRAQHDSTWVRYEKYTSGAYRWRALSPDGTVFYFGDKEASGANTHATDCSIVSAEYAPLTRMVDAFGNQVDYHYEEVEEGECRISSITWGQNQIASLGPFAQMQFVYAEEPNTCEGVPVGSQTSYRTGTKIVTGASQLHSIETFAFPPVSGFAIIATVPFPPEHKRAVNLSYSNATASCSAGHGPYRSLASIGEIVSGLGLATVNLPSIELTYGDAAVSYGSQQSTLVPWTDSGTGSAIHNLGWGYRPQNGNAWPTVEAMMLDVDGDGLVDRITSEPYVDGGVKFCRARWYRNRGPAHAGASQFLAAGYIELPTLKWATDVGASTIFDGGAYAGDHPSQGLHERCALNYQRTAYQNSTPGTVGLCPPSHACPGDGCCPASGYCASTRSDCTAKSMGSSNTHFAWRWMDIDGDQLPDLVGSPAKGGLVSYDLQWGNMILAQPPWFAPEEPAIFGSFPACPSTSYTSSEATADDPYTMCGGMFPWVVFKNHRNGVFGQPRPGGSGTTHATWGPLPDQILDQPIPLETASGDSSITSKAVGQYHGTIDVDGDGFADAVRHTSANTWKVYRNDGTGLLLPSVGTSPFVFNTGTGFFLFRTDYTPSATPTPTGVEGLEDVNGDGLVDHWLDAGSNTASIHLNDGTQFRLADALTTARPASDGHPSQDLVTTGSPAFFACRGTRTDARRLLDVDGDGRTDIIRFATGTTIPEVQYNVGGQFANGSTQLGPGGVHRIGVRSDVDDPPCSGSTFWWETYSDLADLDGDGFKEDVEFPNPGLMLVRKATNTAPPRLLIGINNKRGAITSIAYSAMSSPEVEQHPEVGEASPQTNWVVKSVTTADSFASTSTTVTYKYKRPRFSADEQGSGFPGRYGFRGFEEVETTSQSGAQTIERFSYSPDWSGRKVTTIVKPGVGTTVHTIDDTEWDDRALFGGLITTFHPVSSDHWTCKNGQTEAACRANTDTRTRTVTTLSALASTTSGNPTQLLWQATSSRLQAGASAADGDRETTTTYERNFDADTYRLRSLLTTNKHQISGVMTLYAQSGTRWDSSFRVPEYDDVWFVNSGDMATCQSAATNCATSRREYDLTTGNLIKRWKPVQNTPTGAFLLNAYDSRKLFVVTETDELGLVTDHTWEYGTGTKLETAGPNVSPCTYTGTCPPGVITKEHSRIVIDALGRTVERWGTFSDMVATSYYELKLEMNTYVDTVIGSTPTSVTNEPATDYTAPNVIYGKTKTELDGHGRPTKKTVYVFGSAPADAVTTFVYSNDGTLASVSLPDPSDPVGTNMVAYAYSFDSLGRPTSIRRPDASAAIDKSGVDMTYDGLTATASEFVGVAGGNASITRTTNDAFGRLATVEEQLVASPASWATTSYLYGPDDSVREIVGPGPELVTTKLTHDFAGRRTQIERYGRFWKYGYDKNGNMSAETVPCSPTPACDANYTTTTTYDALDRPGTKLPAPRDLSAADRALFGLYSELFIWDYGVPWAQGNYKGRLIYWRARNAAAATVLQANNIFDAQGNLYKESLWMNTAGYNAARNFIRSFTVANAPAYTHYQDYTGTTTGYTTSFQTYDRRGLPSLLSLTRVSSGGTQTIDTRTRNVAGLVTKRRLGNASSYFDSDWTYDKLGRVASQAVMKTPGPTQVVRQNLTYFGNDDPKTLDHWLGASNQTNFTFGYDKRHQLASVGETAPAAFTANYQHNASGRFTQVTHAAAALPGSNVVPRDVLYQYADADPERVTALVHASDGTTKFASYAYDLEGNQTIRCYGTLTGTTCDGESTHYVYDGMAQLRRATKKNAAGTVIGSEEFWYDGNGKRMTAVQRDSVGTKTGMTFWIQDVEARYDANAAITTTYVHLGAGTPIGRLARTSSTNAPLELQYHGLASNTIAAISETGTINASFNYAPFGEVIESTDAGGGSFGVATHKRRLNDKFEDDLSSLSYYGARYYDKSLIGWTQGDPLYRFVPDAAWTSPRRGNLYAFSLNNSLRYIDPDGRSPLEPVIETVKQAMPTVVALQQSGAQYGAPGRLGATGASAVVLGLAVVAGVTMVVTTDLRTQAIPVTPMVPTIEPDPSPEPTTMSNHPQKTVGTGNGGPPDIYRTPGREPQPGEGPESDGIPDRKIDDYQTPKVERPAPPPGSKKREKERKKEDERRRKEEEKRRKEEEKQRRDGDGSGSGSAPPPT